MMKDQSEQTKKYVQLKLNNNHNNHYQKNLYEKVIERLIPPSNKIVSQGIDLFIPEICFFQDGEPHSFYFNKDICVIIC